jgi:hypothetical protein
MTFEYYFHAGIECVIVRENGIIIFDGPVEDWFDDDDE